MGLTSKDLLVVLVLMAIFVSFSYGDESHQHTVKPESLGPNSDECEWVSLPICQAVSRSWANFPNLLGHRSQLEIANSSAYRYLEELSSRLYVNRSVGDDVDSPIRHQAEQVQRCELQMYQVACSYIVPKCVYLDKTQVTSLPPCKSTCVEVRDRCEGLLNELGIEWPEFLECHSWIQCHLPSVCRHSDDVLGNVRLPIKVTRKRKLPKVEFEHHNERAAKKVMTRIVRHCPDITRLYSVGRSVRNKPLYVLEISDKPGNHESLEPEVKYIGGIHGNEVLGRELLLQLMQFICREWLLGNQRIRALVRNTRIHLMPAMNPDGYSIAAAQGPEKNGWLTGRFNFRGYDLNRQFPDLTKLVYENEERFGPNHHLKIPKRYWREHKQLIFPEIYSVIRWIDNYDFLLSAQLHGGELVANYPYDVRRRDRVYSYNRYWPQYSKCPDDELFRHLASSYALTHRTMADPNLNTCDERFGRKGGITNGAAWYSVSGGMQDFNYLYSNCFEILLELSCRKFPLASSLPGEWVNNKDALLRFIEQSLYPAFDGKEWEGGCLIPVRRLVTLPVRSRYQAHIGIKGFVTDQDGTPISNAEIHVHGIQHDVTTNKNGEYWRMLVPGKYIVTATKEGKSKTKWIIVNNSEITATRYDFALENLDSLHTVAGESNMKSEYENSTGARASINAEAISLHKIENRKTISSSTPSKLNETRMKISSRNESFGAIFSEVEHNDNINGKVLMHAHQDNSSLTSFAQNELGIAEDSLNTVAEGSSITANEGKAGSLTISETSLATSQQIHEINVPIENGKKTDEIGEHASGISNEASFTSGDRIFTTAEFLTPAPQQQPVTHAIDDSDEDDQHHFIDDSISVPELREPSGKLEFISTSRLHRYKDEKRRYK